jgi:hypothetical protein
MEPSRKQFPGSEISGTGRKTGTANHPDRRNDPRGSQYLKGSNSRKVETDPDERSDDMENPLEGEESLEGAGKGRRSLPGETPRDSSQPGFETRIGEEILCEG